MTGAPHLTTFLNTADYFVGLAESGNNTFTDPRGREMLSLYGEVGYVGAWCAVFVAACAKKAGVLHVCIGRDSYANGICQQTVEKYGGTWIPGPYKTGTAVTPQPGDLILFNNEGYHMVYNSDGSIKEWHGSHVGLVFEVSDTTVTTIEGNAGDAVRKITRSLSSSSIGGYARPNWSKVGDVVSGGSGPLYQTRNDRHDMMLREVCYLDSNYKLSDTPASIGISVINYTTVLGDIYDLLAPATVSSIQVDTSQLSGNTKIAMDYLLAAGFSASAASALTGCMQIYSNLTPTYSRPLPDKTYLKGICAWDENKINILKSRSETTNWEKDLTGQLDYFTYDLKTSYNVLLTLIISQPATTEGVNNVITKVMPVYNKYFTSVEYLKAAASAALSVFDKLIITYTQRVGNTTNLKDQNGHLLSAKKSVPIPSSVSQTGIIDDYTSYSAWYSRWHRSSPQKKLANMWATQGYPCDKGVATIGSYYCVAVRPKFGSCGDVIVITLEGGKSFSAIICDEKGEDAGSEWGHKKSGGKISLIEWERVKTQNGKVVTGTSFTDVDKNGFGDWYGKKVINITNYGKYADVRWS